MKFCAPSVRAITQVSLSKLDSLTQGLDRDITLGLAPPRARSTEHADDVSDIFQMHQGDRLPDKLCPILPAGTPVCGFRDRDFFLPAFGCWTAARAAVKFAFACSALPHCWATALTSIPLSCCCTTFANDSAPGRC